MDTSPQEFRTVIETIKAWSRFRLTNSAALALMEDYNDVVGNQTNPELVFLWKIALDARRQIIDAMPKVNWSDVSADAIVLLYYSAKEIEFWINNFLPDGLLQMEFEKKRPLWAWYLFGRGCTSHPPDPLYQLIPSIYVHQAGPHANREFLRRADQHPLGFSAGVTAYFLKARRDDAGSDQGDERENTQLVSTLKKLARASRKHIHTAIRPKADEGKTAEHIPQSELGPLESQAWATLDKDFLHGTPEEILARAIDGRFNVVPLAVAMDILDSNKSEQARFERSIRIDDESWKMPDQPAPMPSPEKVAVANIDFQKHLNARLKKAQSGKRAAMQKAVNIHLATDSTRLATEGSGLSKKTVQSIVMDLNLTPETPTKKPR